VIFGTCKIPAGSSAVVACRNTSGTTSGTCRQPLCRVRFDRRKRLRRIDAAIESGLRWRDSTAVEVIHDTHGICLYDDKYGFDGDSRLYVVRNEGRHGHLTDLVGMVVRTVLRSIISVSNLRWLCAYSCGLSSYGI